MLITKNIDIFKCEIHVISQDAIVLWKYISGYLSFVVVMCLVFIIMSVFFILGLESRLRDLCDSLLGPIVKTAKNTDWQPTILVL